MSNKKEPEVYEIPTEHVFGNHLAESFLVETQILLSIEEGQSYLDAIFDAPDTHKDFTKWLCKLIRDTSYEETSAPKGAILN